VRARQPRHDEDGLVTAILLFALYLGCMALAAYLYWRGTGKPPWS
jgi:hypothetical protein